jgi:hypothetical protein
VGHILTGAATGEAETAVFLSWPLCWALLWLLLALGCRICLFAPLVDCLTWNAVLRSGALPRLLRFADIYGNAASLVLLVPLADFLLAWLLGTGGCWLYNRLASGPTRKLPAKLRRLQQEITAKAAEAEATAKKDS